MCLRTFDGESWSTSESCSHCHVMNPMDRQYCINCGHEAHKPRAECACALCVGLRQFYEGKGPSGITRPRKAR
jgi:hypothetical protein